MVAGELQPTEGRLAYPLLMPGRADARIDWPLVKASIAFVPQELPHWSGSLRDTLRFEAAMHGVRRAENERAVNFIVERLNLGDFLDKSWSQLSGGYRLRFYLARALVWRPRLLVMDEPLANLDIKAKNVLLQDLRELARSYSHPTAVLISSHDLHNLEAICDQIVFVRSGKVEFVGDTATKSYETSQYEIGTSMSVTAVQERLQDSVVSAIRDDGVQLLLTSARGVGPEQVLRLLLERGIPLQYFRDVSRSVSRLFE